ncbi:response regulator [Duganella qianjiadongensis]|uniref:Response regulator n=1 Tax=Duganella qianjiadongensis TaxID=2692176 RepID=A0ABW9VHR8_9BURK|nr:response regulator [Duganella qianjiadongensis]MYM38108.1 response regulator [Duganella qianjiadongensis]
MEYPAHILIVEDDAKIAALLKDYFVAAGYRCSHVADGHAALEQARGGGIDLMLLDLMLPGLDGISVCRGVREFSQLPIIMLTARVAEIDRLLGLETGADDYVCKPFSPREVVARVRVHLRRSMAAQGPGMPAVATPLPAAAGASAQAGLVVQREQMRITLDGVVLALTPVEFRLLAELIAHPQRVFSRQQLLDLSHEDQRDTSDRTVDSHIRNLRRKLAARAECLQSVYGVGYRFEPALAA